MLLYSVRLYSYCYVFPKLQKGCHIYQISAQLFLVPLTYRMKRRWSYRLSDPPQGEVARVGRFVLVPLVIGAIAPRLGARIRLTSLAGGHRTSSIGEEQGDRGAVGRILAPMSEGRSPERLGVLKKFHPHPSTPCGSDKTNLPLTIIYYVY